MGMCMIVAMAVIVPMPMRVAMAVFVPMPMPMRVSMAMVMTMAMSVIPVGTDAAHMQMVPGLQGTHIGFVADDLRPVFAHHAVHGVLAAADFAEPFEEGGDDVGMRAEIVGRQELDVAVEARHFLRLLVDALDEDAVEQEIREHDDAPETEAHGARQAIVGARMGHARIGHRRPAEAHAFPQHARHLGDVRVGVRIVGAAPDDHEQRFGACGRACGFRLGLFDALLGRFDKLQIDRKIATELNLDAGIFGSPRVELPGQVVLDVAGREQHRGHGLDVGRTLRFEGIEPFADHRAREFEKARTDGAPRQLVAQFGHQRVEFTYRVEVAAAVAADHDGAVVHLVLLVD